MKHEKKRISIVLHTIMDSYKQSHRKMQIRAKFLFPRAVAVHFEYEVMIIEHVPIYSTSEQCGGFAGSAAACRRRFRDVMLSRLTLGQQ